MRQTRTVLLMVALAATVACLDQEATPTAPELAAPQFSHAAVPPDRPQTWADGEKFNGVVTPAHFDPASDPFDELYTCGPAGTFADGVPLISDSKPGDQDYNGGRWHLNVLIDGRDCDGTADELSDLVLADFESTDTYFECPLLPRRGRN